MCTGMTYAEAIYKCVGTGTGCTRAIAPDYAAVMLLQDVQRCRDLSMYYEGVLSTQDLSRSLGLHQPGCVLPRIV